MDDLTLAYLAGCMDSDGYFTIRKDMSIVTRGLQRYPAYHEMVGLRQVTPVVPYLLHATFGGSLGITKATAPNGRPLHSWHATSKKAQAVIVTLLPFLRIKKVQAELLVRFRASKDARIATRQRAKDGHFMTVDDDATAASFHTAIQTLNRVGI